MKPIKIALLASALVSVAGLASAQSLEGTARTFFTTAPGVSNFSGNKTCANFPCAVTAYAAASVDEPVVTRRHRQRH